MTAVRITGRALAADRATKALPIVVAQSFFIGAVGISIARTNSAAGNPALSDTLFINVEAHSIAFSALYFWVIPAVFLASVIGVSQTQAAIPRILKRFQGDLDRLNLSRKVEMPSKCLQKEGDQNRKSHGGIYSWQPLASRKNRGLRSLFSILIWGSQRQASNSKTPSQSNQPTSHVIPVPTQGPMASPSAPTYPDLEIDVPLAYSILIIGTLTSIIVSGFVPPEGWNCRQCGHLTICLAWLLSAALDSWLRRLESPKALFFLSFLKDSVITAATVTTIVVTQIGIFNRCSCFTNWGRNGLALPQMPDVAKVLRRRMSTVYPAAAFTSIVIELVIIPLILLFWYRDALRVFVQRDDRTSNWDWFRAIRRKVNNFPRRLRESFLRLRLGRVRSSRQDTRAAEQGMIQELIEMQPLAPTISEEPTDMAEEGSNDGESRPISSVPITTNTASESSSVNPQGPSQASVALLNEPRRRNTGSQEESSGAPSSSRRPWDNKPLPRKPLAARSPLNNVRPASSKGT